MNGSEIKARLQMLGSRIIKLDIKNDFVYVDLEDEDIERTLDVSYELSDPITFDDGTLAGKVVMSITACVENMEHLMKVHLELEGCFIFDEDGTEEELREMLSISGTAAIYSIARGIISGITSQTCANGTLLLPMVNMFELKKKQEKLDE